MYLPKTPCLVQHKAGDDVYGRPVFTAWIPERCAVVSLAVSDVQSSVRADSSGSRGNAEEIEAVSVILFGPRTIADRNDIVSIAGFKLLVKGKEPKFSVTGAIDHFRMTLTLWSET